MFHFQKANLQAVMRDLARWYDIDIQFKTERIDNEYVGEIPRSYSLGRVLHILEASGVHYQLQGNKLILSE